MYAVTQGREWPLIPQAWWGIRYVLGPILMMVLGATAAAAAEFERPVRIAVLTAGFGPSPAAVGLRQGLMDLGYGEDEDFTIGVRFTSGRRELLDAAARDLVEAGAHIIVANGAEAAVAALKASAEIPIVFFALEDPVGMGFIESYSHPGGNITGVTDLDNAIAGKRLELFRELIPGLERVLYTYHADNRSAARKTAIYRDAAEKLGLAFISRSYRTQQQAREALSGLRVGGPDGIISPRVGDANIGGLMVEATVERNIPTLFGVGFLVDQGGFVSYGPDFFEVGRDTARLVDKIIKGADPGDIPVEVNNTLHLVVNLKAARAMGIEIPREALYQANRIIR